MNLLKETEKLRTTLARWAGDPEWALLCRYDLLRSKQPVTYSARLWRDCKNILARCGVTGPHVTAYSWSPALKHGRSPEIPRTLLIWAIGAGIDEQRKGCEGFIKQLESSSDIVPVLVTDTPDFAYYSRLQWLIEYVPDLSGEGSSYRRRKERYLAWRYRDAFAVPVSLGIAGDEEWRRVMEMAR